MHDQLNAGLESHDFYLFVKCDCRSFGWHVPRFHARASGEGQTDPLDSIFFQERISPEEKAKNKDFMDNMNENLTKYKLMAYWSRPAVGIRQLSDNKQAADELNLGVHCCLYTFTPQLNYIFLIEPWQVAYMGVSGVRMVHLMDAAGAVVPELYHACVYSCACDVPVTHKLDDCHSCLILDRPCKGRLS